MRPRESPTTTLPPVSGGEGAHQQPDELNHRDLQPVLDRRGHNLSLGEGVFFFESDRRASKSRAFIAGEPDDCHLVQQLGHQVEHLRKPQDFRQVTKSFWMAEFK